MFKCKLFVVDPVYNNLCYTQQIWLESDINVCSQIKRIISDAELACANRIVNNPHSPLCVKSAALKMVMDGRIDIELKDVDSYVDQYKDILPSTNILGVFKPTFLSNWKEECELYFLTCVEKDN
ncbi:hypothetical protein GBBBJNDB_00356 [Pseudomonas phage Callisto]|nr:hypothetical protein GBBBJNDB_00356 [Pseudomonas phage Callisto]